MAKKLPKGDNRRVGAVGDRSQTYNPGNHAWVKRDTGKGRFIDQKADPKLYTGMRKEE